MTRLADATPPAWSIMGEKRREKITTVRSEYYPVRRSVEAPHTSIIVVPVDS
jgi:hypothetical protein